MNIKRQASKLQAETYAEMLIDEHKKAAKLKGVKFTVSKKRKVPLAIVYIYRTVIIFVWLFLPGAISTLSAYEGVPLGALGATAVYGVFIYLIYRTATGKLDFAAMKEPITPEPQQAVSEQNTKCTAAVNAFENPPAKKDVIPRYVVKPKKIIASAPDVTKPGRNTFPTSVSLIIGLIILVAAIGMAYSIGYNKSKKELLPELELAQADAVLSAEALKISKATVDGLQEKVSALEVFTNRKSDELLFYRENAVIVPFGDNSHHRYGCSYLENVSYFIYNIELAESYGYAPCSVCHRPNPFMNGNF